MIRLIVSFGALTRLPVLPGRREPRPDQVTLWTGCLALAFPGAAPSVSGLQQTGAQLEGLRRLRNRVAHNENLLGVDTVARLNGSLALLRTINDDLPEIVMRDSQLRAICRQDPRVAERDGTDHIKHQPSS